MTKPNEITKALLEDRIHRAYNSMPADPDSKPMGEIEAHLFSYFEDLIGIVDRARKYEMNRCAGVARRLGHRVTAAQIIKEGKP